MEPKQGDIRKELGNRMAIVQRKIDRLKEERAAIDKKVQDANSQLSALRVVYDAEAERFGEPSGPLFPKKDGPSRFAGMKVSEALKIIRKEQPEISKEQAHEVMVKEGFDFGGKRSKSAVHFVWIALERSKRIKQSRKG